MAPAARGNKGIISSYFQPNSKPSTKQAGKRAASPLIVDLTGDDVSHPEPASKKPKKLMQDTEHEGSCISPREVSAPLYRPPTEHLPLKEAGPSVPSYGGVHIETYRFNSNANNTNEMNHTEVPSDKRMNESRREAFKRKLSGENSIFTRREKSEYSADLDSHIDSDTLSAEETEGDDSVSHLPEFITSKALSGPNKSKKSRPFATAELLNKFGKEIGPSGETYTPLENQIRKLKRKYPDVLLMVEVGYKYRFFGGDAQIASEQLGIACFPSRNFLTASIPTHRRDIHLKKLLSQGYKVGIIGQTETAALKKVSDNRNAPFERELTHLYTFATYVDEIDSVDDPSLTGGGAIPVIVCITEALLGGMGADERVSFGLIAVTPSTGDVIWDQFEDNFMRTELDTRLAHLRPSELLVPLQLSKRTDKLIHYFSNNALTTSRAHNRARVERYKKSYSYTSAFQELQDFYTQKNKLGSESFTSGKLLATISDLPHEVVIPLIQCIDYLKSFGLVDVLTQTEFFAKFTERQYMLLNANTLANLEIYRNQTDFTVKGSLIWVLDKTRTRFGSRLMRQWIGKPLVDVDALKERVDTVEEILTVQPVQLREHLVKLRELLKGLPDLAKGLSRIQYGKCTPRELAALIRAFQRIGDAFNTFESPKDVGFASSLLNDIISALPCLKAPVQNILSCIDLKKAAEDKRDELWIDPDKYPVVDDTKMAILTIESELSDQLKIIRKVLKKPAAQWATISGEEYLIEVKKNEKRDVPLTWHVVSSTKSARRYHTPEVRQKLQERAQYQEALKLEADQAYLNFLEEIMDDHYALLRNAVNRLAIVDCLLSLASVALQDDYVKPTFVGDNVIDIADGRHPMVEILRTDPFVPNDLRIGGQESRTKIITGPNMGGKSSLVRMVALIALMAQIGSYVPASSAKLGLSDTILTRMGASDDLTSGRSTFMIEMSETSDILRSVTEKSLVILDELGRGTSTFDGTAIASAVLESLIEAKRCKTLFITHYPLVAIAAQRKFPTDVSNIHMGFTEDTGIDGKRTIVFLYKVVGGISSGSYGIECARLAGIAESVLETATNRGNEMQTAVEARARVNK